MMVLINVTFPQVGDLFSAYLPVCDSSVDKSWTNGARDLALKAQTGENPDVYVRRVITDVGACRQR